jgi:hypothetical protein
MGNYSVCKKRKSCRECFYSGTCNGGVAHGAMINAQSQIAPNEITQTFGGNFPSFAYADDGTIWATTTDRKIYKSYDGINFTFVTKIGTGDPNVNLDEATDDPAEIPIQVSNNGDYIVALGSWAEASLNGDDIVYIYKSTDGGYSWSGHIIGRDEVPGQVSNRPDYRPYFQNFGQITLNVDNSGRIHVAANGFGVTATPDEIVIPALYWNNHFNIWFALTDPAFESEIDAGGTGMLTPFRIYSGNALGNAYPVVSVSDDGQNIFYMWQAPEYDQEGNYVIFPGDGGPDTGPIIYTDILGRYSNDGGATWSEIITIAGEDSVWNNL